jgi:hypothetical protein
MKIPKAESLILMAFLGCVALWAISKCSARRSDIVRRVRETDLDDLVEERPARQDTVAASSPKDRPAPGIEKAATTPPPMPAPAPTQYNSTLRQPGAQAERPAATTPAAPATKTTPKAAEPAKAGSTLFVSIDGLKVRKEPGLKGETIEELALYTPVTFLNQKTEWTQEISLGYEKVTDHWVKIRTASGKTGWVFGAGVHFYKTKRSGVIPESKPAEPAPKKKN